MFRGVGDAPDPRLSPTIPMLLFALFQLKFAIITPALITGAFAERVRFSAYLIFVSLFTLLIYAPLAHWTWHPEGFLRQWGVLDFAGGTVVHMSAGLAALAGAWVLGRRQSHLYGETHVPAHIPFVILGTGMLWFGWFGFNAGSALAASPTAVLAFATTNTASAAAMMAWVFIDWVRGMKPSAMGACIGAVVGLVAITPAAGFVSIAASIVIGVLAAGASNMALYWKSRSSIDDTLDVFPCHGVGGMSGMVLTAVFARDGGLITGSPVLFMKHLAALCLVSAFTFGGSWLLYKLVDLITPLRVDEHHEQLGLDLSQHGEIVSLLRLRRSAQLTGRRCGGRAVGPARLRRNRRAIVGPCPDSPISSTKSTLRSTKRPGSPSIPRDCSIRFAAATASTGSTFRCAARTAPSR